jgi:hypothetical protein
MRFLVAAVPRNDEKLLLFRIKESGIYKSDNDFREIVVLGSY